MKKNTTITKLVLIFIASSILGFCIITNTAGDYRVYKDEDLPFVIQLNDNTPSDFKPVIDKALNAWNSIEGSYFEFLRGADTPVNTVANDGINLLYFDADNENFDENTNTIAFSRTFTSSIGGFHAVESDYIWNAAGYPPAMDGSSDKIDLWTVTMHEVGHHMGLSHNGNDGNSSGAGSEGCGPNLPSSVMYYAVSLGQIKHVLEPHDIMGAVALYPNYQLNIDVTEAGSGTPVENTIIVFNNDVLAASVGSVESSVSNYGALRPGEVYTEVPTGETGKINVVVSKPEFSFNVFKFGYHTVPIQNVSFPQPVGYGDTQYLSYSFELQKSEVVELSGSLISSTPDIDFTGEIEASWVNDKNEVFTSDIDGSGNFSVDLPEGNYYNVKVHLSPPYQYEFRYDSVFVGTGGLQFDIDISPTNFLLVNSEETENENYSIYMEELNQLGVKFSFWNEVEGGNISEQSFVPNYKKPYAILWNAGGESSSGLTQSDRAFLISHLQAGNNLILTGDNIAENSVDGDVLFNNYLGVKFSDNSDDLRLRGFKDDLLGNAFGASFTAVGKDLLELSNTNLGNVYRSFYIGTTNVDTANIVGVRSEGTGANGWRAFFMSAGIHHTVGKYLDTLMTRSIKYVMDTSFVSGVETNFTDELPNVYSISQNYPNPFNPSTTIKFALPVNADVKITVYNILGEQIDILKDEFMNSGSYELKWDATNLSISSGIYFYRIEADGINGSRFAETKKMILLK